LIFDEVKQEANSIKVKKKKRWRLCPSLVCVCM